MIDVHERETAFVCRVIDGLTISGILFFIVTLHLNNISLNYYLVGTIAVMVFTLSAELSDLYRNPSRNSPKDNIKSISIAWSSTLCVLLSIAFITQTTETQSRLVLMTWGIVTPLSLMAWRYSFRLIKKNVSTKEKYQQKCVIVGASEHGVELAKELHQNRHLGYNLLGVYDDRDPERLPLDSMPAPLLGSVDEAIERAKSNEFRHVYIALPMLAKGRVKEILSSLSDTTARVYLVPDFYSYNLMQSKWRNVGSIPTLSVHDTPFYGVNTFLKRLEDVVIGSAILAAISPILAVIAIGVKLSSPGPVIFKQDRYGLDGKKIKVYKFRSMKTTENGNEVKQATKGDPRVTKFGAFIRKTSLDELPQFINVLQGRMSIVGPRPHAVAHNEEYRKLVSRYMLRHKVKPGITGWAQVNGFRGETDTLEKMEKRIEFDLRYIQSWSLYLDLKIIFLTIFKGFVGKTAY